MAKEGTNNDMYHTSLGFTPAAGQEFTMGAKINYDVVNALQRFICLGDESGTERVDLGIEANGNIKLGTKGHTATEGSAVSSGADLNHAVTYDGVNTFEIFIEGVSDYTVADGGVVWGNLDTFSVLASRYNSILNTGTDGIIGECYVYDVKLNPDELVALVEGVTPDQIRLSSLIHYLPLVINSRDSISGNILTTTGSPIQREHFLTKQPSATILQFPPAAAVAEGDLLLTNRSIANYGGMRQ